MTIELDEQATEKRIIEIRKQLDFLGEAAKGLKKDFKDGTIGTDEYYGGLERVKRQSTELTKELALQRKGLENLDKSEKAAAGSLVDLKAKLSNATKAHGDLSREQRNNADIGGELAKTIKAYSDELKEAEETIGMYYRSVGNYEKGNLQLGDSFGVIKGKISELQKAYDSLSETERENQNIGGKIKDSIEDLNNALKEKKTISDYAKELKIAGVSIGDVQNAIKGGTEGFKVFTKGITLSKGALIALSAIPILLLLTGLVALLTRSQAGMDKLAQFTKAADLAITSLTQGFVKVGQAVVDFFSAKNFASLEAFKNAFLSLEGTTRNVASGMREAAKAGIDIAKASQAIEAAEIELNLVRAQSRAEIEKQKKLGDDVTKSNAVRSAALKQAYKLENDLLSQSLKIQKQRVAVAEQEFKFGAKTRADRQKVVEETAKLSELEQENAEKTTELQNNLNGITLDGIAKAKEARALANAEAIADAERAVIVAKKKGEDTLRFEVELIKRRAKADADAIEKGSAQKKLIALKAEADIANLRIERALDAQAKINAITASGIEASLTLTRAGSKEELALIEERIRKQGQAEGIELERQLQGEANRIEREVKQGAVAAKTQKAIDEARKKFAIDEVNRNAEIAKLNLQSELDRSEMVFQLRRDQADKLINIEEEQQLALLALEEISDTEREAKKSAIQATADKKRAEARKQLLQDELNDRIALLDAELEAAKAGSREEFNYRRELLKAQLAQELLNFEGSEKQKAALKKKYAALQSKIDKEESKQLVNNIVNATETGLQAVSGFFQAAQQERQNAFDAEQEAAVKSAGENADLRAAIEKNFAARKAELDKKAANERKKIALAEAAIGIAKGIIAAQELPPPFSFIQAALVGLTGLAQIAVISAQKFNRGGVPNQYHSYQSDGRGAYLSNGPGTSTSDSIPAKLSVKESVMNAKATAKYYDTLSAMNAETGGVSFPGAKPISTMPAPVQSFKYGVVGLGQDTGATIGRYIDDAVSRIQPVLVLETLNQVNGRVNRTQVRQTIK